jgi:hypothetical protein
MVDRDQRLVVRQRHRLAGQEPDHDAADQPGAGGCGDAVQGRELKARFAHRRCDRVIDLLDVRARGDFRHHAQIGRMRLDLRPHHVRQDLDRAVRAEPHDRGCGFVAARLDSQDDEAWHRVFHRAG